MMTLLHRLPAKLTLAVTSLAYVAIGVASLVPKTLRPTSGMVPGPVEHLAAYFFLGLLSAYTLRDHISPYRLIIVNALYAGILEIGQHAVPGRIPTLLDFSASAVGSCVGIVVVLLLLKTRVGKASI